MRRTQFLVSNSRRNHSKISQSVSYCCFMTWNVSFFNTVFWRTLCFLSVTSSGEVFWGALTKMGMKTESFVRCRSPFTAYSLSKFGALSKSVLLKFSWSQSHPGPNWVTAFRVGKSYTGVDPACPVTSAQGSCTSCKVCCCPGFCDGAHNTGSPSLLVPSAKYSQCFPVDSMSYRARLTAPLARIHCLGWLRSGTSLLGDSICLGCPPSSAHCI